MPRWQVSMISGMELAMIALWKVRESPTEIGIAGNIGATPPASNMTVRFGECVFCASIAAAQGAPVPTTTVAPSSRFRAATHIINSIGL
jgi:hypothetical protein